MQSLGELRGIYDASMGGYSVHDTYHTVQYSIFSVFGKTRERDVNCNHTSTTTPASPSLERPCTHIPSLHLRWMPNDFRSNISPAAYVGLECGSSSSSSSSSSTKPASPLENTCCADPTADTGYCAARCRANGALRHWFKSARPACHGGSGTLPACLPVCLPACLPACLYVGMLVCTMARWPLHVSSFGISVCEPRI